MDEGPARRIRAGLRLLTFPGGPVDVGDRAVEFDPCQLKVDESLVHLIPCDGDPLALGIEAGGGIRHSANEAADVIWCDLRGVLCRGYRDLDNG